VQNPKEDHQLIISRIPGNLYGIPRPLRL